LLPQSARCPAPAAGALPPLTLRHPPCLPPCTACGGVPTQLVYTTTPALPRLCPHTHTCLVVEWHTRLVAPEHHSRGPRTSTSHSCTQASRKAGGVLELWACVQGGMAVQGPLAAVCCLSACMQQPCRAPSPCRLPAKPCQHPPHATQPEPHAYRQVGPAAHDLQYHGRARGSKDRRVSDQLAAT